MRVERESALEDVLGQVLWSDRRTAVQLRAWWETRAACNCVPPVHRESLELAFQRIDTELHRVHDGFREGFCGVWRSVCVFVDRDGTYSACRSPGQTASRSNSSASCSSPPSRSTHLAYVPRLLTRRADWLLPCAGTRFSKPGSTVSVQSRTITLAAFLPAQVASRRSSRSTEPTRSEVSLRLQTPSALPPAPRARLTSWP